MKLVFYFLAISCAGSIHAADSLDIKIGQMILIGLGDFGTIETDQEIFNELAQGKAGSVILFEKNLTNENSRENLKTLVNYTQSRSLIPLFVSIDEEGGRVTRLKTKYGFPKTVSAKYLGALDNADTTKFYATERAQLLKELGINMNFAPCVDVNVNLENPVIGKINRSFSSSEHQVASQAQIFVEAYNSEKVVPVLKHFPGHGSSQSDTHLGVADVSDTWEFRELYPYKALIDSGVVTAVMTAHIVNRTLDQELRPATLSHQVVQEILRGFLGFNGVIISDDLQMKAIADQFGLKETIRLSIQAGLDILLFANNVPDHQRVSAATIHKMIKEMVQNGDITPERIDESYQRVINLKSNVGLIE